MNISTLNCIVICLFDQKRTELLHSYANSHEVFFAKHDTFDIAAYSKENIQNDLQKALHIIRCIENKDLDISYSLTPNTAHCEEKFNNSENNHENEYKLLEDIAKTKNSAFFDKEKYVESIENEQCAPDDNLNEDWAAVTYEDWAAVTLHTMTDKEYMENTAKLTKEYILSS